MQRSLLVSLLITLGCCPLPTTTSEQPHHGDTAAVHSLEPMSFCGQYLSKLKLAEASHLRDLIQIMQQASPPTNTLPCIYVTTTPFISKQAKRFATDLVALHHRKKNPPLDGACVCVMR